MGRTKQQYNVFKLKGSLKSAETRKTNPNLSKQTVINNKIRLKDAINLFQQRANHETNTWYTELCRSKGKKFARYQSSIENKMWHHKLKIPAKGIKTLNRLIAGHDYGNFWLHKVKLIDRGTCVICNVEDTASHRVFYCHKFDMERKDQLEINEQNFIKAWKTKDKKKIP